MIQMLGLFEAHLPVANLARATDFYTARLGLTLAHVVEGKAAFLWIGPPGQAMLGLWESSAPQQMILHLAFRATVEAVTEAPATLRAAGITPLDFDGRAADEPCVLAWMPAVSIYFRDPDGHHLEYLAMLAQDPRPELGVVPLSRWNALLSRSG